MITDAESKIETSRSFFKQAELLFYFSKETKWCKDLLK